MMTTNSNIRRHETELLSLCRHYVSKPLWKMTNEELIIFSNSQARDAERTTRIIENGKCRSMTQDEVRQYALSVYESVRYFNLRDQRHAEEMRYLEECRRALDKQGGEGYIAQAN